KRIIADYSKVSGDYIAFKFTGEIATTKNGLSEGMLWDFKEKKVANWLLDYYGIDHNLTPPIVENFENQGTVNQQASDQTGLPKGIPIRYRSGDQPNNAWALNILKPGEIAATGGTSGVLFAVSDREVSQELHRVNHFAHVNYTNAHPVVGSLLCINGAGIQYSWLKKITGFQNYQTMNAHAEAVPIGSQGLINLPFGNGAERMFNNKTVGAHFSNLNLNIHLQGHLCRSVLEGIAFSFAYGMEILSKDALDIQVIRAGNDNLFRSQIFSDTVASLIGQPIEIYKTTGAVGAARAAGIQNRSFDQYSSRMSEKDRLAVVLPQKKDAYLMAYQAWKKELNKQLNNQNTTQ
ncbi:MAG: FGGY-family carbohydrate kinase, partial [Flavobacteriaceae bacterium]